MLGALPALWPLPQNASLHGYALDHHLVLNLWIALALAALANSLLLVGLRLCRHQAEAASGSRWVIGYLPLAVLTLLFAALTVKAERLWAKMRYTGAAPDALQVEAVGVQFAWYFRYPGKDATFGRTSPTLVDAAAANPLGLDASDAHAVDDFVTSELVLPLNREVDLTLRAQDVIHGLSIPELRLKQNAIPGETIHLHFTGTKPGIYAIVCSQLCGLGHYRMQANLRIVPEQTFADWTRLKRQQN